MSVALTSGGRPQATCYARVQLTQFALFNALTRCLHGPGRACRPRTSWGLDEKRAVCSALVSPARSAPLHACFGPLSVHSRSTLSCTGIVHTHLHPAAKMPETQTHASAAGDYLPHTSTLTVVHSHNLTMHVTLSHPLHTATATHQRHCRLNSLHAPSQQRHACMPCTPSTSHHDAPSGSPAH